MTEPTTETTVVTVTTGPLPPADGTYHLSDDVPLHEAITVGFVGGREQKASHLYKDGRWVRLVPGKAAGVVEHEEVEEPPPGAPVGVPAAGHAPTVLITNAYEVAQGLERAKPADVVGDAADHGPGVGTTVPQAAAASAANTALVAPAETATATDAVIVPEREETVVGVRKAANRQRPAPAIDEASAAAPLKP